MDLLLAAIWLVVGLFATDQLQQRWRLEERRALTFLSRITTSLVGLCWPAAVIVVVVHDLIPRSRK